MKQEPPGAPLALNSTHAEPEIKSVPLGPHCVPATPRLFPTLGPFYLLFPPPECSGQTRLFLLVSAYLPLPPRGHP